MTPEATTQVAANYWVLIYVGLYCIIGFICGLVEMYWSWYKNYKEKLFQYHDVSQAVVWTDKVYTIGLLPMPIWIAVWPFLLIASVFDKIIGYIDRKIKSYLTEVK